MCVCLVIFSIDQAIKCIVWQSSCILCTASFHYICLDLQESKGDTEYGKLFSDNQFSDKMIVHFNIFCSHM
jgi:hypothetical protein